jgi:hypothetical protein
MTQLHLGKQLNLPQQHCPQYETRQTMEKYIKRVGKKEKAAMMRKSDQRYPVAIEGIRSRAIGQALLSQVYKIWNYGEVGVMVDLQSTESFTDGSSHRIGS